MRRALSFQVDIEPSGDRYLLRCRKLGTYAWSGSTPRLALEAFADDVSGMVRRYLDANT